MHDLLPVSFPIFGKFGNYSPHLKGLRFSIRWFRQRRQIWIKSIKNLQHRSEEFQLVLPPQLPDQVRREILELGFPDDGYNYFLHMREIKNTGSGSSYYHNPKANLNELPRDVKAYDASRVEVCRVNNDSDKKLLYNVASRTVGARLQKVVDPEVAAMLDDSDSSKFGSDVEDLEEDFIMRANFVECPLDFLLDKQLSLIGGSKVGHIGNGDLHASGAPENEAEFSGLGSEKPRAHCLLDERFDLCYWVAVFISVMV
ncbi:uncharacterized protein LOC111409430 [Olea europaea var. sylvestris]|uniref:uncharacterized protein LOC111409430 n=1 Tax=Olea europaea var. sylvestris TaxID=158386 RepID=UPI000C1D0C3A|nr:uncharacterized protein LOC111409430 [Olea europaea var. sylvestris]